MSKKYSDYDHLPRSAGTNLLTPGAACTYLEEEHGISMRPTSLASKSNYIQHYRNGFGNLAFDFKDLDDYASMFEVKLVPVGSAG